MAVPDQSGDEGVVGAASRGRLVGIFGGEVIGKGMADQIGAPSNIEGDVGAFITPASPQIG